ADPGASDAPWAVDVNWGDGSAHSTFTTSAQGSLGSLSHSYADGPAKLGRAATRNDKDGGVGSATFTVTVANVAPTVTAPANQSSTEGAATAFSLGSFADPGASDGPWAVDVNWGDGSAHSTFTTSAQGSLGSLSHSYADGPA